MRFSPGRPPKLSTRDRRRLVKLLQRGARAHGYATDLWTTERVARLNFREFRVRYHRAHVGRVLHSLGWTVQKPERRELERDEERIARWKQETWPRIKKRAARLGAHLVVVDESGCLLIPRVRRTWAPRGQAPLLRHRYGERREVGAIEAVRLLLAAEAFPHSRHVPFVEGTARLRAEDELRYLRPASP